jgi:hypothetical protein
MKKLLLLTLTCALTTSIGAMELTESDSDLMVFMKEPVPVAIKLPSRTKSVQSESSDKIPARKSRSTTESSSESETTLSSGSEKISNPVAKSDNNEFVDVFVAAAMFASPQELKSLIHAAATVATSDKKDKQPRISVLLQQEVDRLSSAIAETKDAYEENKKKGEEALKQIRTHGGSFGFMGWTPVEQTRFDCEEKCQKLHKQLIELEQQSAHTKYQLFRNHIKHSHPTKLKMAIPNAVGCFDKIVYESEHEKISYPKYCLFTQEQKMDLHAYAQTIVPKRFEAVQGARDNEDMFTKPHDPKVREKHEKACKVVLLMKEFKNMSFNRQQSFSNCLTYKATYA